MISKTMLLVSILLFACLNGCQSGSQPCNPSDCDGCGPESCNPQVVIVAWTAEWCRECQSDKPSLRYVAKSGISVVMVDFDENPELAKKLGIEFIPAYFIYIEDGDVREDEVRRADNVKLAVKHARELERKL